MAKKPSFEKFYIYAEHAPDSARVNTDNPGWRQHAKDDGVGVDENDLIYGCCDRSGDQNPDIIDLTIRRGVSPKVVVATLRKMIDLIERHGEYLSGDFVTGDLTINDDGSLGPVTPFDDEIESPALQVVG